jgi:hypothetical protein
MPARHFSPSKVDFVISTERTAWRSYMPDLVFFLKNAQDATAAPIVFMHSL